MDGRNSNGNCFPIPGKHLSRFEGSSVPSDDLPSTARSGAGRAAETVPADYDPPIFHSMAIEVLNMPERIRGTSQVKHLIEVTVK